MTSRLKIFLSLIALYASQHNQRGLQLVEDWICSSCDEIIPEMKSTLDRFLGLFSLLVITALVLLYLTSWDVSVYSVFHQESPLCACHTCLTEGDPQLKKLIKSSPEPFLSKKHKKSQVVKWWKALHWGRLTVTIFNNTVDSLFEIFPPVPDVAEPSPDRCITCAVVGNSGNLKGSHYGPLIDFHDVVIRMNRGRTEGYEEDVGTKTTHHVMYPESVKKLHNNTHLVFFPFKTNDLLWLHKKFQPDVKSEDRIANKDLVMILNPAFMKYVHEAWLGKKGSHPSTGFLTVALSMRMCDEVSVFGFGADKEGNWNHYFETLRDKNLRTGPHSGTHEYDVIQQLYKKKKINLFKGF